MYRCEYRPIDFSKAMQTLQPNMHPMNPRGRTKAMRLLAKGIRVFKLP
jgi:hypothetical protein